MVAGLATVLVTGTAFASVLLPGAAGAAGHAAGGHPAEACPEEKAAPAHLTPGQMATEELCLINRAREHFHLVPLTANAELEKVARSHSNMMVRHHFFSHDGPGGSVEGRIGRSGYLKNVRSYSYGENIGAGHGLHATPYEIYEDWMHSPIHRANILGPHFREVGVGVAPGNPFHGPDNGATYTADFGVRVLR